MIVDASAIISVLLNESDADAIKLAMAGASSLEISAANYLEVCIRVDGLNEPDLSAGLLSLIRDNDIEVVPVTPAQAEIARAAYRRFGKGNHPARLNFGDTFAYALAMERGLPLLFKGRDFSQTDVNVALPAAGPGR